MAFSHPSSVRSTGCCRHHDVPPRQQPYYLRREQRRGVKHSTGYQAMGSFHSESPDELMAQSTAEYRPPTLPFEARDITSSHNSGDDFMLDRKTWTFLNHGAFGAALRVGYQRSEEWRRHLEAQPLRYFDRDLLPHLVHAARRLAEEVCSVPPNKRELSTLISNVTMGTNTIFRGYVNTFGTMSSHIILWDTSYGSTKKIAEHCGAGRVSEIPLTKYLDRWGDDWDNPNDVFELALDDFISTMKAKQDQEGPLLDNALLVLDHTTSNTALNMPLAKLSKMAKEHNMLVMVDGAHGLLAQDVCMPKLPHVDFYVANGHKWMACPRGVGWLYCANVELRDTILAQPAIVSHGVNQGFQSRFLWDGTRDYSAALSLPVVLDYWEQRGLEKTRADMKTNLHAAVDLLQSSWHSSSSHPSEVTLAPLSVHAPMMALVRLPGVLQKGEAAATSSDAKRIQDYLFDQFIEVPIKCIQGILYVRISSHVYNEVREYDILAEALQNYKGG